MINYLYVKYNLFYVTKLQIPYKNVENLPVTCGYDFLLLVKNKSVNQKVNKYVYSTLTYVFG